MQFSPKINCFIGNNGMGKTNVLDAVYYLSFSKCHALQGDAMVIRHEADYMMLKGSYQRRNEPEEVTLHFSVASERRLNAMARSTRN